MPLQTQFNPFLFIPGIAHVWKKIYGEQIQNSWEVLFGE